MEVYIMGNLDFLMPGKITLDSRQVAKMVNKRHDNLIRDIDTYVNQMEEANKITTSNLRTSDYFIKSKYLGGNGEKRHCYKITKMGCDFIAHKMTGIKGTAFTATYIKLFYKMEDKLKLELQAKEDFKEMTDAIKKVKENPKPYHFSNEINMINRVALGCTSKEFKIKNNITQDSSIRNYLSYEQLQLIDVLQKLNASMILLWMKYDERKTRLQNYRLTLAA
jgi:Rha family phage regulatory protein